MHGPYRRRDRCFLRNSGETSHSIDGTEGAAPITWPSGEGQQRSILPRQGHGGQQISTSFANGTKPSVQAGGFFADSPAESAATQRNIGVKLSLATSFDPRGRK